MKTDNKAARHEHAALDNLKGEKFMAYVKPVRPALVIAADKVKKFEEHKTSSEIKERRDKLAAEFRANNKRK